METGVGGTGVETSECLAKVKQKFGSYVGVWSEGSLVGTEIL